MKSIGLGPAFLLSAGVLAAQSPATAFIDVHVLSMKDSAVRAGQTVLVENGVVVWVGPNRLARVPPAARRIEGRGGFLLPGFADMHVHLGRREDLLTYLANGITTVRNMAGNDSALVWRRLVSRDSLLGPRIVTTGPILDGDPPAMPGLVVFTDPARARAEVEALRAAGYDLIKVYNSLPRAVYDTIVVAARDIGLLVTGHVPFEVGLAGALAARQASIEHLRGYVAELVPLSAPVQPGPTLKQRSVVWNYVDRGRIPALAERTRAAGVWNCPTLVVTPHNLLPAAENARLSSRPEVRYLAVNPPVDRARVPYLRDFTDADYREAQRGLGTQLELVGALYRAGAGLLAGTDSWLAGFALQEELELLDRAGIPRSAVLRNATRSAAEFLGEDDPAGRITAGAPADLQLIEADPLLSLGNLRRRVGVMARGRWYPKEELVRRLEEQSPARPGS